MAKSNRKASDVVPLGADRPLTAMPRSVDEWPACRRISLDVYLEFLNLAQMPPLQFEQENANHVEIR
jgi:hypothetical protein